MEQYHFFEGELPSHISWGFSETLFSQSEYRKFYATDGWLSFYLTDGNSVVATMHFHISEGVAKSPLRAPHGGVEGKSTLSNTCVLQFLSFIDDRLKEKRIKAATIKLAPSGYFLSLFESSYDFYLNNGFRIISNEPQSVILVSSLPYEKKIHRSERKRLRKCVKADFKFKKLDEAELNIAYEVIRGWRRAKGFDISMSFEEFIETRSKFRNRYPGFAIMNGDKMVAASICILVSNDVLYDFAHDHDADYDSFSPITLLVQGLYEYCQNNAIAMLDLGTSISGEKRKDSLVEFKVRLGATNFEKLIVEKVYE